MSELRGKVARGAAWMLLARACDRGLGLVSTLILARLLAPDDFGVLAMAMGVVALLEVLRAFGLDVALIRHEAPERVHYDTAWTMNLFMSAGVTALLTALAIPTARFFGEPRLVPVMFFVALVPLISALENIGVVDFRRYLQFDREFRFTLLSRLAGFSVTIPLAFALRNEWALVLGMMTGRVVQVLLSYVFHPFRPRPSVGAWRELYGFSKWLFVNNVIQLATRRSVDFIVGRLAGPRALGLFTISHEIAFTPSSEFAAPINRAVLPGLARQDSSKEARRRGLLDVLSVVALAVLPAGVGLMVTADFVVPVLLGDKWLEAIPLFPPMALYGIINSLGSPLGSMFLALGTPRMVSRLAGLQLAVLLPAMLAGVRAAGAEGAAWSYVVASLVAVPLAYVVLMRRLEIPLGVLIGRLWRPCVAVGFMAVLVRWAAGLVPDATTTPALAAQLLLVVAIGAASYGAFVLGLWWLSGRPAAGERILLDAALRLWERVGSSS